MAERRTGHRIPIEFPVEIQWRSPAGKLRQARGESGDISGSGLFVKIPTRPRRATSITIRIMLPPGVTHVPVELFCKGRVIRWNRHGQVQGLAAVIDEYELRPQPKARGQSISHRHK